MRDWKKLRVFEQADSLALLIHRISWPKEHRYGLASQIQRAATSVASNIVEGSARTSEREYLRFLEIAYASACELSYQLSLARRLEIGVYSAYPGYDAPSFSVLEQQAEQLSKALGALIRSRVASDL